MTRRTRMHAFARLVATTGRRVAVAESLSGGALALAIVEIPGSGEWFRGGVVAYDAQVKRDLLGVADGPVITRTAALQMAAGVGRLLGADVGIATTGCAGPEPMEDQPVGTLWVAATADAQSEAYHYVVDGDPDEVRAKSVKLAF